jgi:hypothetical protein
MVTVSLISSSDSLLGLLKQIFLSGGFRFLKEWLVLVTCSTSSPVQRFQTQSSENNLLFIYFIFENKKSCCCFASEKKKRLLLLFLSHENQVVLVRSNTELF